MRFALRLALAVLCMGTAVACGGGGSSPGSSGTGKPAGASTHVAISLHVPAPAATSAAQSAASRASRARPRYVSPASNGLAVRLYTSTAHTTLAYEADVDISGANTTTGTTCTPDAGDPGRTCSITITEPTGTYDFVIATYASAPGANGFSGDTVLDIGDAGTYTLTSNGTTTIGVTLGADVAAIKLNAPASIAGGGVATIPVGIVALDAANDVILSSSPYATPITLAATADAGIAASLSLNGAAATSSIVSTAPTDTVALAYGCCGNGSPRQVKIAATTPIGTSGSATITPLFVTDSANAISQSAGTAALRINETSGSDSVTLQEGSTAESNAFSGSYTITPDPVNGCVTNGSSTPSAASPLVFTYGGVSSTTPPAALAASGGGATLAIATGGFATPANGCVYKVSDGTTTTVTLVIRASAVLYTPCTGSHLYVNDDVSGFGVEGLVKYALPVTSASTPVQLESAGQNVALAFDPSCNAYLDAYFSSVFEYASPYTGSPIASYAGAASTDPYGIAVDNAGHLFIDESNQNQVIEVSSITGGSVLATMSLPAGLSAPYSLALDSAANLYVGCVGGIAVFAPPYTSSATQTILAGSVNIQALAFDAQGNLFAADTMANQLTVLAPPYGSGNVIATNTNGISVALGLAVDGNGNVYAANYGNDTITGYAPPYTNPPFVTLPGGLPDAAAIGP